MPKKPTELLIETSALNVALGESAPNHIAHFQEKIGEGKLFSSTYIRNEFNNAWVKPYLQMVGVFRHYDSVDDAIAYLSEDFSSRKIKVNLRAVGKLLEAKNAGKPSDASVEIARLAFHLQLRFDRAFKSRIRNRSKCQIGEKKLMMDFNSLMESIRHFFTLTAQVDDCEVKEFLKQNSSRAFSNATLVALMQIIALT